MTKLKKKISRIVTAAGGHTKLAQIIGTTPQAIHMWRDVPVAHVLKIEKATGIPRYDIRPDVYPKSGTGALA